MTAILDFMGKHPAVTIILVAVIFVGIHDCILAAKTKHNGTV